MQAYRNIPAQGGILPPYSQQALQSSGFFGTEERVLFKQLLSAESVSAKVFGKVQWNNLSTALLQHKEVLGQPARQNPKTDKIDSKLDCVAPQYRGLMQFKFNFTLCAAAVMKAYLGRLETDRCLLTIPGAAVGTRGGEREGGRDASSRLAAAGVGVGSDDDEMVGRGEMLWGASGRGRRKSIVLPQPATAAERESLLDGLRKRSADTVTVLERVVELEGKSIRNVSRLLSSNCDPPYYARFFDESSASCQYSQYLICSIQPLE